MTGWRHEDITTAFVQQLAQRPVLQQALPALRSTPAPLPPSSRPFILRPTAAHQQEVTARHSVQVLIKPLKGAGSEPIELAISRLDSIHELKRQVARLSGIPAAAQRLVLGGKGLVDTRTLLDYGVVGKTTLHLARKPGTESLAAGPLAAAAPSAGTGSESGSSKTPADAAAPNAAATPAHAPLAAGTFESELALLAANDGFWTSVKALLDRQFSSRLDSQKVLAEFKQAVASLSPAPQ
ncbi:hypothetical protein BC831DRAFT_480297 [Entophlyctis helioformis]|nr:hypothetical protein BC831DRAFT_480297 [Entophlyctis helioformis]